MSCHIHKILLTDTVTSLVERQLRTGSYGEFTYRLPAQSQQAYLRSELQNSPPKTQTQDPKKYAKGYLTPTYSQNAISSEKSPPSSEKNYFGYFAPFYSRTAGFSSLTSLTQDDSGADLEDRTALVEGSEGGFSNGKPQSFSYSSPTTSYHITYFSNGGFREVLSRTFPAHYVTGIPLPPSSLSSPHNGTKIISHDHADHLVLSPQHLRALQIQKLFSKQQGEDSLDDSTNNSPWKSTLGMAQQPRSLQPQEQLKEISHQPQQQVSSTFMTPTISTTSTTSTTPTTSTVWYSSQGYNDKKNNARSVDYSAASALRSKIRKSKTLVGKSTLNDHDHHHRQHDPPHHHPLTTQTTGDMHHE